jgi:hypothetical protein
MQPVSKHHVAEGMKGSGDILQESERPASMIDWLIGLLVLSSSSSFLGSTAQFRPCPTPQNPAEFLGGFSTIFSFYRVGLLAPRPTPIPEDQRRE